MKKVKNWVIIGVIVSLSLFVIKLFCKPSVHELADEIDKADKKAKRDMFSGRRYIKVQSRDNSEVEEFARW